MKKILYILILFITLASYILRTPVYAGTNVENDIGPIPCFGGACPPELDAQIYQNTNNALPSYAYSTDKCVSSYEEFLTAPERLHFWAEDVEVTNQGKADERARQFIYWVITKPAIDNHAVIRGVWNTTRNISYFLVIIVAVVIGIGFIISQRTNFNLKIQIWPAIWKILFALLYITFSAAIIFFLIQISELLMKFFIESLGGKDLFNIYFSQSQSSESNYTYFFGCRDLNIRSQEAADTEMLMLKFTNITYYVMGSMLLLRKILLWFLLFVSPFLAILMPFVFIRNTGWIWIGVFFQWLFYGPLFALFLGALASIWKAGIPFQFDFSRRNVPEGYIYPTAIRILYGGPAQRLTILNNANYIDTYVEYIITLLMLWAVTFFPWWLLRIFRDYCCDVFAAANNVLISMYDQMRAGPIVPPPSGQPIFKAPPRSTTGTAREIPRGEGRTGVERPVTVRIQSISEIKQAKTQDILSSLNLYAPRLTDIARYETNSQSKNAVQKNLSFISNPVKAETPTERQQYMNIRTELFSRAAKDDKLARSIISSTSTSFMEKEQTRSEILKSTPQAVPVTEAISSTTQLSKEKVQSITNNIVNSVVNNNNAVSSIAERSQISQEQVKSILNSYSQNMAQPANQIVSNIAQATNSTKEQVSEVIKQAMDVSRQTDVVSQTATREKLSSETVQKLLQTLPMAVAQQQSQNQTMTQNISMTANIPQEKVQSITNNIFNNVANTTKITSAIAESTNLSQQQVKSVLSSYSQNMNQTASQMMNSISQQTNVSKEKVAEVLQKSNKVMQQSAMIKESASSAKTDEKTVEKIVQSVKESLTTQAPSQAISGITAQQKQSITTNIFNTVINDTTTMQTLQKETNLPANQLRNVLSTYSQNVNQTPEVIAQRVSQSAGIEKSKVAPVLKQVLSTISNESAVSSSVINDIAKKENVKPSDVKKVVESQVPLVTEADKHIEKSIPIPSTISIEDYEEVKKMWTQQYEKGEVPTTENLANREQWVDQDMVTITNTLNKLMSNDETLQKEGLDDLGYILPVFMINNMKGDEMMVYLKAKLEAAKAVKEQMSKVKEAAGQVVEAEEELVEVSRAAAEAVPEVMHMAVEEEIEQPTSQVADSSNYSSYTSSVGDTTSYKVSTKQPVFILKADEIKGIKTNELVRNMNMFAEKLTDIARLDTNRETRETVTKHIEYLANPEKSTSATERQTYKDIRSELTTRGVQDQMARQLVSPSKEHMLQTVPQALPAVNVVSNMVNLPQQKVQSITSTLAQSVSQNNSMINSIAQNTQLPQNSVQTVFNAFTQNIGAPTNQIINNISQQTNIPKEKVTQILQQVNSVLSQSSITQTISAKEQVSSKTITDVLQALTNPVRESSNQPVTTQLALSTKVPAQTVNMIIKSTLSSILETPSRIQYIQNQTGIDAKQAQTALTVLNQKVDASMPVILNQISQQAGITPQKVNDVIDAVVSVTQSKKTQELIAQSATTDTRSVETVIKSLSTQAHESVTGAMPVSQAIASETNLSETQTQSIITSIINNAVTNEAFLQNVQNQTGVNQNQVKKVLTTYAKNSSMPSTALIDRIAQTSGVEKQKIGPVLQTAMRTINTDFASSKDIIKKIAAKEGITEDKASEVLTAQVPMVAQAEEHVEKSVPIPAGVSIEDYEEVKKMWAQQYEKGEVPTGENITSREQWIDQDTVMLTNVLNKLLSTDEKLRREALDDVGVLLPIFMVNNLSGEELLVYLKAKLEAARSIKSEIVKVRESQEALAQPEEEFVEIPRENTETQTQTLQMEVEESAPKSESTATSVSVDTSAFSASEETTGSNLKDNISSIKKTRIIQPFSINSKEIKAIKTQDLIRNLNMFAEKLTDIARLETNRETREMVTKHIEYLANPEKSTSATERQTYLDIRSELTTRGVQDQTARQLVSPSKEQILQTVPQPIPLSQAIATETKISEKQAQSIITSIVNNAVTNEVFLQNIQNQTGVNQNQVKNILTTYAQNSNMPSTTLMNRIAQTSGVEKHKIGPVLQTAMRIINSDTASSKDIIKKIAAKEGITEDKTSEVLTAQVPLAEEQVEKSVPIPAGVSIEDYEEVKKMWAQQYEKGEVPTGESITSREQWIDQDTIMLTNILNKLLSSDEKLKQEALDDIGMLLPIFMVNNLTGEELLVYLKAKLEAAKLIKSELVKFSENESTQSRSPEELVEVQRENTKAIPQTLHMETEESAPKSGLTPSPVSVDTSSFSTLDEPEKSTPTESISSLKATNTKQTFSMNTDEIKTIKTNDLVRNLNMFVEKLSDIARLETNHDVRKKVQNHIQYLADPNKAVNESERQTYISIRNELQSRAPTDKMAAHLVSPIAEHILPNVPKTQPVANAASTFFKLPPEKMQSIVAAVVGEMAQNKNVLNDINQHIQIPQDTIQNLLITFTHNLYVPAQLVINTVGQQLDIPNETVSRVLSETNLDIQKESMIEIKEIVKKTATVEKVPENLVKEVINTQILTIIAPTENIENTIPLSGTVSLEDYEEVKNMWADQYEKGEVPVGDKINSRESWINQDIILITNILNKLLSEDKKAQHEAMEEISFLLPLFMLNNLTGQELVMYLKAKLEAAKLVLKQLNKENDLKNKLKMISAEQEEIVDIKKPKSETKKALEMTTDNKSDPDKK